MKDSESKKKDYVFDSELRPLRNISLYEVQCKLNASGAVGKLRPHDFNFYYI